MKHQIASARLDRAVRGARAMIRILRIAAAMLLAPASVRANAVEIVRVHPAELQPGGSVAPGSGRPDLATAACSRHPIEERLTR